MAAGIAGAGETLADTRRPLHSIAVMVVNEAAVPSIVLARAEMEAASIYQRLGVNLIWVKNTDDDREYRFTIKVVAKALPSHEVDTKAMGVAPGTHDVGGTMAYAFYGRIRTFSETHRIEISSILGSVIAHELGHLLLPQRPHSRGGLMSGGWDAERAVLAAKGLLMFSATESILIRNRLLASTRPITGRPPNAN